MDTKQANLLRASKALLMHVHQGNVHPIDYQRLQQAVDAAEGKSQQEGG